MVFLIWMAPIIENMEEELREEAGEGAAVTKANVEVDVELPSFIDDMCTDIVVWEEGNIQRVEAKVKRIVRSVAEEYNLPIGRGPTPEAKQEKEERRSEVCQVAGSHFRRLPGLRHTLEVPVG